MAPASATAATSNTFTFTVLAKNVIEIRTHSFMDVIGRDQLFLRIGHFARECPSYTGLPHPGARREGGGGGGGGREYGTSKCLKCNR